MIEVPSPEDLSDFDLRRFTVPPLEKYTDKRGYLYVLFDECFPEYIKVGRSTDVWKRLLQYNSDKPFKTAKMLFVSRMFEDAPEIERRVLQYMYSCTRPTTLTKEWFEIEHKDRIVAIIEKAEILENGLDQ